MGCRCCLGVRFWGSDQFHHFFRINTNVFQRDSSVCCEDAFITISRRPSAYGIRGRQLFTSFLSTSSSLNSTCCLRGGTLDRHQKNNVTGLAGNIRGAYRQLSPPLTWTRRRSCSQGGCRHPSFYDHRTHLCVALTTLIRQLEFATFWV